LIYQKPTVEQIVKYLKLIHNALIKEKGFLCEKEIISRIVNDTIEIGLSKAKIKQLLLLGEN